VKDITINYLSHKRLEYSALTFHYLNKIKSENKRKIRLNILASVNDNWTDRCDALKDIDYQVSIANEGEHNYLDKLSVALGSGSPYSIKLDEDCFVNNYIWDYLIENISELDNEENLLLSPIFTNHIPSCDLFIEGFIKDISVKDEIHSCFLNQRMPNGLWGVNYESLDSSTIHAKKWLPHEFYKAVKALPTPFKGIHPLRISAEAQRAINEYVVNNIDIINQPQSYSWIEFDSPYFTNNFFAIKTDVWADILRGQCPDAYDEVCLNIYKEKANRKILFINNGVGVHLMYNTVFGNQNPWGIGMEDGEKYEKNVYHRLAESIVS